MKPARLLILFVILHSSFVTPTHAGPRTSTNYAVPTDSIDSAGKRTTSANYSNAGSLGGITGVATVSSPAETVKHGYIGQLYEVTALQLTATPTTMNETATQQLSATQWLDDLTINAVPAASITWSIVSGPLSNISIGGLATAATVYENTAATAQGIFAGNTGTLGLTVLDTIPDNFGAYAADGLGDDWQVQYFSQPPNANAAPLLDPDNDGFNNLFEFTAGIVPTDALSVFHYRIESVAGFPAQKKLIFSPLVSGRTYTMKTGTTLDAPMTTLTGSTSIDTGNERAVTDTNATGSAKFYTVEIVKP